MTQASDNLVMRPARPGDVADIIDVVRAAYAPYVPLIGREPAPMSADYAALVAADRVRVLCDPAVVGVLVLARRADHLLIENVAVAPALQGTGLGRRLLAAAEAEARAAGLAHLRLFTNAGMEWNIQLYRRIGFRETGRCREGGFDRVYMTREVG